MEESRDNYRCLTMEAWLWSVVLPVPGGVETASSLARHLQQADDRLTALVIIVSGEEIRLSLSCKQWLRFEPIGYV